MITDDRAEKAVDFIVKNSTVIGKARADMDYIEAFLKSKKALLIKEVTGTVQDREAHALAHPEYIELINGYKEAVERYETLRWKMIAAQEMIEIWRTQSATARAERKAVR